MVIRVASGGYPGWPLLVPGVVPAGTRGGPCWPRHLCTVVSMLTNIDKNAFCLRCCGSARICPQKIILHSPKKASSELQERVSSSMAATSEAEQCCSPEYLFQFFPSSLTICILDIKPLLVFNRTHVVQKVYMIIFLSDEASI